MRVIHVVWLDSEASTGWESPEEIEDQMKLTHTVGLFVKETLDAVVIAHSYDPGTSDINGRIHIPFCAIQEIKELCTIMMK